MNKIAKIFDIEAKPSNIIAYYDGMEVASIIYRPARKAAGTIETIYNANPALGQANAGYSAPFGNDDDDTVKDAIARKYLLRNGGKGVGRSDVLKMFDATVFVQR